MWQVTTAVLIHSETFLYICMYGMYSKCVVYKELMAGSVPKFDPKPKIVVNYKSWSALYCILFILYSFPFSVYFLYIWFYIYSGGGDEQHSFI